MSRYLRSKEREELLADTAELYFEQARTQDEISQLVGVTRSAISRMLREARQKGIVEIRINRPLRYDDELEAALQRRFDLITARVLLTPQRQSSDNLRSRLGKAAAKVLVETLRPNTSLGLPWGTTIAAAIEAVEVPEPLRVSVVQLVGVLGSKTHAYNAQALVEQLARRLGGEGFYLYAPLIVESAATAQALYNNQNVRQALEAAKGCEVALLGIGTTDPEYSSMYLSGHVSREVLDDMRAAGAVGDVSAHHFDIEGRPLDLEFHQRLVGITRDDLIAIPTRLAVAGGKAKAPAILGALRGSYVNALVTDSCTAELILTLDQGGASATPGNYLRQEPPNRTDRSQTNPDS